MSGSYSGGGTSSRISLLVAFLLGMALLTTLIAIAVAMGVLRLGEAGPIAGGSPSPTTLAAASPTGAPTDAAPTTPVPATASPTPAPTEEPSPTMQATPGGTHIVQSGESLSTIAMLYGVSVQAIIEANEIDNPDRIFLGQQLLIPVPAGPGEPGEPGEGTGNVHVVRSGESISSIALLYGISPTELADANNIENWDLIYAGQELIIPGGEGATPAP